MAPLRVALVCPYSWSVPGGVQTHVRGLAEALGRRGIEAAILAPADEPVAEAGVIALGGTIGFHDNGTITRIALGPGAIRTTRHAVRAGGFDLVHLHEPMLPHASFFALQSARVPVVGTFHMLCASDRWYRLFGPVVRRSARRLRARIAVSRAARDFVSGVLPGDYHVIPNALHVAEYRAGTPPRGGRLLYIGRAEPRKGLPVLLRAFEGLGSDVRLDLAGVTPAEVALLADGIAPETFTRVRALGRVSDDERRELLASASVLCVPSLGSESFGLVLVEGMAAGVPVVASNIAGYRDVLPRVAGRLVPPGEPDALTAALRELLADAALRARLGDAGQAAARRYDWSVVGDEIVRVYEQALAR